MRHNRNIIYLAGFLFSIPLALTSYINSSFLENYTDRYHVGIVYIIASVISVLGMLTVEKLLTIFGNRKTTLYLGILVFLSFLGMALGNSYPVVAAAFVLNFVTINLIIATLDIFVEDFSKESSVGKFRGLYLTILNSAWVIAQLISGSVIAKSSFRGIYLLSSLFMLLVCAIFVLFLQNFIDPKYKKVSVFKNLKYFIRNKHLSKIYLINLILKFFYAWMVIYTPIYLHEYVGFNWEQIGIIFTIMLCAFFIELPLGRISDRSGEKKILLWGFIVCTLFTLLIPFFTSLNVLLWAGILFGTRIGAAMIEVMSESYFFKVISEENADAISFFRNTGPLSYIIAPLCAIPVLFYVPSFQYLFYVLGAILLVGFFVALRLKDVR